MTEENIQEWFRSKKRKAQPSSGEKDYLEGEKKRALLVGLIQDIQQRKEFGNKIYWLIVFWVIGILVLLSCQGVGVFDFNLSDKVLITLIGGTTLNVLGIFVIVAKYFFRTSKG